MPTPEDEHKEAILFAVRREVEKTLAGRGAGFSLREGPVVASGYRIDAFITGYDGTETTVAFTADISVMDATTLDSEDIVTL